MGDLTAVYALKQFVKGVVEFFGYEYLRPPKMEEKKILLQRGEMLGFPGMLGGIDCCTWTWNNCPTKYHVQYKGE